MQEPVLKKGTQHSFCEPCDNQCSRQQRVEDMFSHPCGQWPSNGYNGILLPCSLAATSCACLDMCLTVSVCVFGYIPGPFKAETPTSDTKLLPRDWPCKTRECHPSCNLSLCFSHLRDGYWTLAVVCSRSLSLSLSLSVLLLLDNLVKEGRRWSCV